MRPSDSSPPLSDSLLPVSDSLAKLSDSPPPSESSPSASWDEVLILHEALHSDASQVCVGDKTLDIYSVDNGERWLKFRGVKIRTQAPNNTNPGKTVQTTKCKMTFIQSKGKWGQIIDGQLRKSCSFLPDCMPAGTDISGVPPAKKHRLDQVPRRPIGDVSCPRLPPDLNSAKAQLHDVDCTTEDFQVVTDIFAAYLHGDNDDYSREGIMSGKRPTTFVLVSAQRVDNCVLASNFQLRRQAMTSSYLGLKIREQVCFHGTHPSHLDSLCNFGLLPAGHELNPCQTSVDSGSFGSCSKGIYLSRHADCTFRYANGLLPLKPGDRCKIMMFKCLPGKSLHIETLCGPIDPTPGYDSHSGPHEWYLFKHDQCLPTHVLTVQASEETRTVADYT